MTKHKDTVVFIVSAPYHSYEGTLPSGRTTASFDTLDEAVSFIRRVEIYQAVNPDYPYGIGAHLDPDHEISVREFGFDDGCLTGPLSLVRRTTMDEEISIATALAEGA